jgi:hypothetical protein
MASTVMFDPGIDGMTDASATRSPPIPRIRSYGLIAAAAPW